MFLMDYALGGKRFTVQLLLWSLEFTTFLDHFSAMFHFYTPSKRQKTKVFLTFSWGIEMEHWAKIG